MSGSLGFSTVSLTDAERTDVRRFCGYPAYGSGAAGFSSWRFFTQYGELEYRMNNLSAAELQVVRQYLTTLYGLETGVPGSAANLDTDQAAVWHRNKNEPTDRMALFRRWRMEMVSFFGIPPGPAFQGQSASIVV